jgi:predicted DCC family thiol-disulfide oxidoreductase YuxK
VEKTNAQAIVLFDGICNLCNGAVQFILKRDKNSRFRFASLQSEFGQEIMRKFALDPSRLHSILLLENGKMYQRSEAAIMIASALRGWSFMRIFRIIPKFLCDAVYNVIARHRYRVFGKREECMIPAPEWKSRFIE